MIDWFHVGNRNQRSAPFNTLDALLVKESSLYSLQVLPGWHLFGEYRRRLTAKERPVCIVNGDEIGLQITVGTYTLIATSYDYFDGCHHWFYLLDEDGRPIDQLRMPDEFGFIQDATVVSENELTFGYFGTNDRWTLVVSLRGFWSYEPSELLRRPNRFLLMKRYLSVQRQKGEPWAPPEVAAVDLPQETAPERSGA